MTNAEVVVQAMLEISQRYPLLHQPTNKEQS